ncbi:hypothetical protein FG379_001218 [Cryptosporidium bovis]|uniref:uncharacterized protein n=1 Tax=Cryptosporidium bovis TaxID=310047 RepID=UPI003519EAE8|nr:hypothetical protein FG379_001218 [Cryptosporidium bovis]
MSDKIKGLAIPSHLRLDTLSLSCISTGLTPKNEAKSTSLNRGALSTRSFGGKYLDFDGKVPLQLPSSRSLRTSQRVNRSSIQLNRAGSIEAKKSESGDEFVKKQVQETSYKSKICRGNVTTPKGFEFATNERAEQRLRHQRSSSSGAYLYGCGIHNSNVLNIRDLSLNMHQISCGKSTNPPISARSCSSIGANSRMSNRSRMTTIPRPFHFETDLRASNKSKILSERLGSLKERFNEEVLNKNREYNEDKRLRNIIESIRDNGIGGICANADVSSYTGNRNDTLEAKSGVVNNNNEQTGAGFGLTSLGKNESRFRVRNLSRSTTIPKSPKFATQMRLENKRAQLRGLLDSLISGDNSKEAREDFSEPERREGISEISDDRVSNSNVININKRDLSNSSNTNVLYEHNSIAQVTSLVSDNEKKDSYISRSVINNDSKDIQGNNLQKLPKLRGFLSMNSFSHLGRQSVNNNTLDSNTTKLKTSELGEKGIEESTKGTRLMGENDNNNSLPRCHARIINSIRRINALETSIPNNWKFQATIARKQLQQLIGNEDTEFISLNIDDNSVKEREGIPNEQDIILNDKFSEEDLKTPLPRTFR